MKAKTGSIFRYIGLLLVFIILSLRSLSQDLAGNPDHEYVFQTDQKDKKTAITSDGLRLTATIQRPVTLPQTSDPGTWKTIGESSVLKTLTGIKGHMKTTSYLTNTGQLDCQVWISDKRDLLAFRQVYTNTTRKTVILENLFPLFIDGMEPFEYGEISGWRILEQFRHKNDLPKSEIPGKSETISCDPFLIINDNNGSGRNLFIGYQTFNLHLAEISISFDNTLQLVDIKADCDFEGVEVPVNGNRTSQWVILSLGADACSMIDDFTQRVREYHNIKTPGRNAPSVYCTWYYHALNYNEEIFKRDIEQFRKEHLPFDVFLIDECWDVDDWGDFEPIGTFPGGMKRVAEQIRSTGYIPGIWTAPFLTDHGSDLVKNHPAWLLKNSRGEPCIFKMNNRDHFILDLTYPGVCEYIEEQFRKISRDWGYNYFKFDFMRSVFVDSDQQFFDKTATSLEAYRRGLEAIRRGTGNDAYISVCGGHYGASLGIANTQRSGSDVKSRWDEIEIPKYRQNILRTWMSGLWHVDPDAMMVRRQMNPLPNDSRDLTIGLFTDDEAFTNAVNQFIGGNLITFTEDFAIIDQDRKMLYKHVIPPVNSSSRPVDIFNMICPEIMVTPVSPVSENLERWNMVSIVNWSDEPKDYNLKIDAPVTTGMKSDKFVIFDFQSQEIIGSLNKGEELKIKGVRRHQSRLLKIIPWDGVSAIFVGTDLNFSCGGNEITEIYFEGGRINGTLDTQWNVPVTLSFLVPVKESFEKRIVIMVRGQKRFYLNY